MKSSLQDLQRRGYIEAKDVTPYHDHTTEALYTLLDSKEATERTIAVRLLTQRLGITDRNWALHLLTQLTKEKALYTKLETCQWLEGGDAETAEAMIPYLGMIGCNQHRVLPKRVSKKISYPLPRDIIARTLGKMRPTVLPTLMAVLGSDDVARISEALDAIGFMLFYHPESQSLMHLATIERTMARYRHHDVILWKCVLCLSALWFAESIQTLEDVMTWGVDGVIVDEARRSIQIIKQR